MTLVNEIKRFPEFEFLSATDSETTALKIIKSEHPEVVIVDIDLSEGCGISLMRILRSDRHFDNNYPYIIAMTGFMSTSIRFDLKRYADKIYYEDSYFNPANILINLSFNIFEKSSKRPQFENRDEQILKQLIEVELTHYYVNPKKKQSLKYMIDAIYHSMQQPDLKLKKIIAQTAFDHDLKATNLHSVLNRYLHEAFDTTNPEILDQIAHPYNSKHHPSLQLFIIHISERVNANIS